MNLVTDLPPYANIDTKTLNVVIEIPKWTCNKIEYRDEGYFELDRVLYHQMYYNFDYGFIPQTIEGDGDPCDVILLTTHSLFAGCVVKCRLIGAIQTSDQDGADMKFICVPESKIDPRRSHVHTIDDLNTHAQQELLLFFKEYKKLEVTKYDKVTIGGFQTIEQAHAVIVQSIQQFQQHHTVQ